MKLTEKKCLPCEGGVQPMNQEQTEALLPSIPSWSASQKYDKISREFTFSNFIETMAFVNTVAEIAEREQHHPDIECGYNYCRVHFSTHAIGGLSENDFICAAHINEVANR